MNIEEFAFVQAVPKAQFNPASLTGDWQPMNAPGFAEPVKIWKLYNGSPSVSIDISFDAVTAHDFIPPLGTLIVDFQANHDQTASAGTGTLRLRKGQILWGRIATEPAFLQIIGYK
jgi:hypothetical protein